MNRLLARAPRNALRSWASLALAVCALAFAGKAEAQGSAAPDSNATETAEAQAGDEEARMRFEMARSLVASGELELAHRSFLDGYRASRRPLFVFNMAECSRGLGQFDKARREYAEYLRLAPEGGQADAARERLAALGPGDTSQPDYLVLSAPEPERDPEPQLDPQPPEPEPDVDSDVTVGPPEQSGPEESRSRGPATGPIVLAAAGGAMLVAGIGLAIAAGQTHSDLENGCDDGLCDPTDENVSNYDKLPRLTRAADVFLFGGGAVMAGGLLWWLLRPDQDADTQVNVGLEGVSVRGSF
ncbi:MAG: hypothetical protein AAF411_29020 [Myxococcota bacterium]